MMTFVGLGLWSLIAFVVLKWDGLPNGFRRAVGAALLTGAGACLLTAPLLSGDYSQKVVLFIGGPYPYEVETVQRSYAGALVGVAAVLLAVYGLSRWGRFLPGQGPLGQALKLSLAVIALRVYLEKLGVSPQLAMLVGVIWLAAPLGVYFGVESASHRLRRFWMWLLGYAFGLRVFIIVVMTCATLFQLGTHFDNSGVDSFTVFGQTRQVEPRSWDQIAQLVLLPQLLIWPAVTILAGILFGLPARLIAQRRVKPKSAQI